LNWWIEKTNISISFRSHYQFRNGLTAAKVSVDKNKLAFFLNKSKHLREAGN
jgi:hypothetical protein